MTKNADFWIKKLNLQNHPEGGYFKEIYRSNMIIKKNFIPEQYKGQRNASTLIYFLLKGNDVSNLHRLKSDEIGHFYYGSTVNIHIIEENGNHYTLPLGNDIESGESFQVIIKGGLWFGAELKKKRSYALIGCTVAPGFDFKDFELAKRNDLIRLYPQLEKIIKNFTILT